jgi:hypothetical protein
VAERRRAAVVGFFLAVIYMSRIFGAQQTPAPPPDYSSRAREVVAALAARQFDSVAAQFNDTKSAALSGTRIGNAWEQVIAQSGPFQKIDSVQVADRRYHVATVTCSFERAPRQVTIYFDDGGRIAGLQFPPATSAPAGAGSSWDAPPYADSRAFREEAVTIVDGRWQLPGTLTLPNGKAPSAAVVFVSGSGPNDADETIGPNKPLKDLAWGLASKGIAALRYPKRTHQYGAASSASRETFTVKDEYLDDARAAVALLASRPEINPKRIFLAGHSEGGYLAPRIALGNPQVAGIIILEGNTRRIEQGVVDQLRYLAGLGGANAADIEKAESEAKAQAEAIDDPGLKAGTTVKLLNATVPATYFLDLREYDPAAVAARLKIPIYVTQGGRDYQVTTTDFEGWKKALAGRSNATLKLYPSLDHLLVPGEGPSAPRQYLEAGRHVSAEVVADLITWIAAR